MAPVNRRPGTRNNPSSTQQEDDDQYPLLSFEDDDGDPQQQALTQGDDSVADTHLFLAQDSYTPQCDNPSELMPDGDDDCALKEHMHTQERISQ